VKVATPRERPGEGPRKTKVSTKEDQGFDQGTTNMFRPRNQGSDQRRTEEPTKATEKEPSLGSAKRSRLRPDNTGCTREKASPPREWATPITAYYR